ncbi:heme oxygenase-like protein [Mycena rebaudengoi]|nr:heme oxygenase-like protein [Mycena rebaudengoi]
MSFKLTDHLLSLSTSTPYAAAINHPFLQSAGDGTLDNALLSLWLSQDHIYASHAYPRFIGSLIAAIPFDTSDSIRSDEEASNQRILKVLTHSLENIVREAGFFVQTADKWGLQLDGWRERKATRDYVAEMGNISRGRIEDGLVYLWAMERVYLDAWSFVQRRLELRSSELTEVEAPLLAFVSNWTSPEFHRFVDDLAALVNTLTMDGPSKKRAEKIWARVIELEKEFWPSVGEEVHMRI